MVNLCILCLRGIYSYVKVPAQGSWVGIIPNLVVNPYMLHVYDIYLPT